MTPKEKAKELVQRYIDEAYQEDEYGLYTPMAKQCALIAVDEMLKVTPKYSTDELLTPKGSTEVRIPNCTYEYLEQVKQEIEKL